MNFLYISHAIVSFLLVLSILLQAGDSGMFAMGGLMAGGDNFHTRRGLEKIIFIASWIFLAIFIFLNVWLLIV